MQKGMPKTDSANVNDGHSKRGPGRPPKTLTQNLSVSPPNDTKKGSQEEPRKKITNCSLQTPFALGRPLKRKGRPRKARPPKYRNRQRPPPVDTESASEDDIPSSFSEVVKIIIQKVQETQNDIRNIEESYQNYKNANEESTILALKFYAAVPKLQERVAGGESFNDDLLNSVFNELFPVNGMKVEPPTMDTFSDHGSRPKSRKPAPKSSKK